MNPSEKDLDVLARTLWGEARGEGMAGMIAVGWTIRNRVEMDLHGDGKPDWWGEGYTEVCKRPWQFSCWNPNDPNHPFLSGAKPIPATQLEAARKAAAAAIDGTVDPTGGATHYFATTMFRPPAWARNATHTVTLGRHMFFKDVP